MARKIVGLTGLAGSGKDSVADVLVNNLPNWEKMSLAGHLKDVTALLFGFDRKMLSGETIEDREIREQPDKFWSEKLGRDFTPRYALQFLGTDLLRNQFHQNIWIDCMERKILNSTKNIIITDARFPNDIDAIRRWGGEMWRIEKHEMPEWFRKVEQMRKDKFSDDKILAAVPEIKNIHETEWKWVGYDNPSIIFYKEHTLSELKDEVLDILKKVI